MVARHPLDSDDTIHIRSENGITTTNNINTNNNSTNTDNDDEDTIALWKPPASASFVVGLDLDDSGLSRDASNSPNDNSLLRENLESPPTPSTKFCEDFLHHHQQEQQEQEPHSLFLTEATPLKCLSTTNATTNTASNTNENFHATATTADVNNHHLEDRIADLEFKLATLSRLWQAQESNSNSFAHSRSNLAQRRGSLRNGRQGSSRSGGGVTLVRIILNINSSSILYVALNTPSCGSMDFSCFVTVLVYFVFYPTLYSRRCIRHCLHFHTHIAFESHLLLVLEQSMLYPQTTMSCWGMTTTMTTFPIPNHIWNHLVHRC